MIEFVDVYKYYNTRAVLKGVSMRIERGETFVIIGQSGTGKTVSLRHIAGLVDPDGGDVIIDGVKMNGAKRRVKTALREKMGVLFQSGALINWMTVGDNIALPLVEHRLHPPDEIEKIVAEKLHMLQLTDARDKMPADISGGMRKRAGLARSLVRNPEIILYDEPSSGLDPVMTSVIDQLIRRMQREYNITSVVVTHDMGSAYAIADRIAMLYQGEIIQCGTPDEIRNTENPIVRQFITGPIPVV